MGAQIQKQVAMMDVWTFAPTRSRCFQNQIPDSSWFRPTNFPSVATMSSLLTDLLDGTEDVLRLGMKGYKHARNEVIGIPTSNFAAIDMT